MENQIETKEYIREFGSEMTLDEMKQLKYIIYRITNKIDGNSYFGQTVQSFRARYSGGQWWKNTSSIYLERAIEKYGKENFKIELYEFNVDNINELNFLESFYICVFNTLAPNGYNMTTGGKNHYPCQFLKDNLSEKRSKEYHLIDYLGNEFKFKGLRKFCKENNLNKSAMSNMVTGITTSSQGYALYGTDISKITNKIYKFENIETHEVIETKNLKEFSQKYNLCYGSLAKVCCKYQFSHRNWKIFGTEHTPKQKKRNQVFQLINDKNEAIEGTTKEISRLLNTRFSYINRLIKGRCQSYKGWRLVDNNKSHCGKGILYSKIVILNLESNEIQVFDNTKNLANFIKKSINTTRLWLLNKCKIPYWQLISAEKPPYSLNKGEFQVRS